MADPRPGTHNGPPHAVPDSGAHAAQPPAAAPFSRPFTLYEALPYTPFSSIAPFDSGRFRGHTCDTRRQTSRGVQSASDFPSQFHRCSPPAVNRLGVPRASPHRPRSRLRFRCTQPRGRGSEPSPQALPTSAQPSSTPPGARKYPRVVGCSLGLGRKSANS